MRGGGGDAVVVGEEPFRLGEQGVADAPIDSALGLEEGPDVQLEQPGAVLAVELGEFRAGQDRQEDGKVLVRARGRQGTAAGR